MISKVLDKIHLIVIDGKMIIVRLTLETCIQAHRGVSGLLEFTKQLFYDGHQNSLKHQCEAYSLEPIEYFNEPLRTCQKSLCPPTFCE